MSSTRYWIAIGFVVVTATFLQQAPIAGAADPSAEGLQSAKRETYETLATKLEQPVDAEFVETPLKDVAQYFADLLDLQIVLNSKELERSAIGIETPVTVKANQLPARLILPLILEPMDLAYVRRDGYIEISTPDHFDRQMEPRIYRARELPGGDADQPDVDAAIELIQKMIQPDSWKPTGGSGEIVRLRTVLVIRQPPRVHEQIDDLLRRTREALTAEARNK